MGERCKEMLIISARTLNASGVKMKLKPKWIPAFLPALTLRRNCLLLPLPFVFSVYIHPFTVR